MDKLALWRRYKDLHCRLNALDMSIDISRMGFDDEFFTRMEEAIYAAFDAMTDLEGGAIANPDEQRMVGHYWLRDPDRGPTDDVIDDINRTRDAVVDFAEKVHDKQVAPPTAARFTELLVVGIGGSALGPQLISDALSSKRDKMTVHFLDNTDPDGIERTLQSLGARIKSTLAVVISKSAGTPETPSPTDPPTCSRHFWSAEAPASASFYRRHPAGNLFQR